MENYIHLFDSIDALNGAFFNDYSEPWVGVSRVGRVQQLIISGASDDDFATETHEFDGTYTITKKQYDKNYYCYLCVWSNGVYSFEYHDVISDTDPMIEVNDVTYSLNIVSYDDSKPVVTYNKKAQPLDPGLVI